MAKLTENDLESALNLLQVSREEVLACDDLKRIEITALKRWHPDRAIGAGLGQEEIDNHTRVFQKIPICLDVFKHFKAGDLESDAMSPPPRPRSKKKVIRKPAPVKMVPIGKRIQSLYSPKLGNVDKLHVLSGLYKDVRLGGNRSQKYLSILNNAVYSQFVNSIDENNIDLTIGLLAVGPEGLQRKFTEYINSLALTPNGWKGLYHLLGSDSPIPVSRFILFLDSPINGIDDKITVLINLKRVIDSEKVLMEKHGRFQMGYLNQLFLTCIYENRLDLIKRLFSSGVKDAVIKNNFHLAKALDQGDIKMIKFLLKAGANQNEVLNRNTGWTLLMDRIKKDADVIIKLLIKQGANVNAVTHSPSPGWNALLEAVDNGRVEIVRLLLKSGADPRYQNSNGMSAVKLAQIGGNKAIQHLLRKKMK